MKWSGQRRAKGVAADVEAVNRKDRKVSPRDPPKELGGVPSVTLSGHRVRILRWEMKGVSRKIQTSGSFCWS